MSSIRKIFDIRNLYGYIRLIFDYIIYVYIFFIHTRWVSMGYNGTTKNLTKCSILYESKTVVA